MRKYTEKIDVRLSQEQVKTLTEKAAKAGLSREEYCRRVFDGSTVKEAPDADTKLLIREMRKAGYSLNGILKKANAVGIVEVEKLKNVLEEIQAAIRLVVNTFSERRR